MNFLDPDKWADLEQLEKDYQSESLDEERVKQLHERLRPYFLRRTKKEVLKLPPKNEVIVPLSMLPLQRDVYKSLYKGNTEVLRKLTPNSRVAASISSLRNILMQLRKCLQHPYLISSELEPENLSEQQAHERLIETSTKLLFLKQLLPQLKARGHRVLIFTQVSYNINIDTHILKACSSPSHLISSRSS
jgi:chromodomain-helicase-DNA-binding protein 4